MDHIESQNRTIVCCDCGQQFVFSSGEARFHKSKGFTPPRRCKPCRQELRLKKKRSGAWQSVEVQHGR